MSFQRTVAGGMAWSFLHFGGKYTLTFVVVLILVRILPPQDFGLVALAVVFIEFAQIIMNQGIVHAIVQRGELESAHLDSAFIAYLVIGIGLTGTGLASSDFIARLLHEPQIKAVLQGLSLIFVFGAPGAVYEAILKRNMQFKILAVRVIYAESIGGIVAILLALYGCGVWSLVVRQLLASLVGTLILWRRSDWRPIWRFSWRHYRDLMRYGLNIMGVMLLRFFRHRTDIFLIGTFLGPLSLGYYSVARRILNTISTFLLETAAQVAWPMLSRFQMDPEKLRQAYDSANRMICFLALPAFFGVVALSPELVLTICGERWSSSIPLVRAFAIFGISQAVLYVTMIAISAVGKVGWRLFLEFISTVISVLAVVSALSGGLVAVGWAFVGAAFAVIPLYLILAYRILPISVTAYLHGIAPSLGVSVIMAGLLLFVKYLLAPWMGPWLLLALSFALGALIYLFFMSWIAPAVLREARGYLRLALSRA